MGNGGYTIVDKQVNAEKTSGAKWLATDFELPTTSAENLAKFFHISFAINGTTVHKIFMTKDGGITFNPINNNSDVDGWFYRSDVITKGDELNFKVVPDTAITLDEFVLMMEE